jgi:ketosteroid isomerase-like protein
MNYINVIRKYFQAVTERNIKSIILLFDENCEVFFAKAGILNGKKNFDEFNHSLKGNITELKFDMDNFKYTITGNTVIVEGQESGVLSDGFTFENNNFCSIFEFILETNLIKRMFVYTDPNFGRK